MQYLVIYILLYWDVDIRCNVMFSNLLIIDIKRWTGRLWSALTAHAVGHFSGVFFSPVRYNENENEIAARGEKTKSSFHS